LKQLFGAKFAQQIFDGNNFCMKYAKIVEGESDKKIV